MLDGLLNAAIDVTERGRVPDNLVRFGIRQICGQRLREERRRHAGIPNHREVFLDEMSQSPIALVPESANDQHYEAPAVLFERALGPRLKYSSCYWPNGVTTLAAAEEAALSETAAHASLADGQDVLELGCGWGSLTLWMAERYPSSRITAVSNSTRQRTFILQRAADRGLANVDVVTADINRFDIARRFDRVVSVEMFEHMRNYSALLDRIAGWMHGDAKLFIHIFCHRKYLYPYSTEGAANWLGRHFFTGGLMPDQSLLFDVPAGVQVADHWQWDGTHYERTANAWLANLDANREELMYVLADHYGQSEAARWFGRWRMFFMACAELFGYRQGSEWQVGHYLLERRSASARDVA